MYWLVAKWPMNVRKIIFIAEKTLGLKKVVLESSEFLKDSYHKTFYTR